MSIQKASVQDLAEMAIVRVLRDGNPKNVDDIMRDEFGPCQTVSRDLVTSAIKSLVGQSVEGRLVEYGDNQEILRETPYSGRIHYDGSGRYWLN